MENFIREFYYGNLEPQECSSEFNLELKKKLNEICQLENQFTENLTEEERLLFSEYTNKYLELMSSSITDGFINGFRFGAKFTYDTFIR